ncbi:MAG TPA: hypothetical protein VEU32_16505 [Burkholderiales bacterium]|nr:hypothetical protein [Burkholderiales bacterium]
MNHTANGSASSFNIVAHEPARRLLVPPGARVATDPAVDEPTTGLQEIPMEEPLRTYYGEERRRLFADYDGIERRIPDPPTEQDRYREAGPN